MVQHAARKEAKSSVWTPAAFSTMSTHAKPQSLRINATSALTAKVMLLFRTHPCAEAATHICTAEEQERERENKQLTSCRTAGRAGHAERASRAWVRGPAV